LPTAHVTLKTHESKSGNGKNGPWTLHVFTDEHNQPYKTFEAAIGNLAYGLINQPAIVTYDEKAAKDPKYPPDRNIRTVEPAPVAPGGSVAPPTAPVASIPAPTSGDDRELRIMRQSGLERAAKVTELGLAPQVNSLDDLFALSDVLITYFQRGRKTAPAAEQAVIDEFASEFGTAA
jgi:hypothetical protein